MNDEQARNVLKQVIQDYRKCRERLVNIQSSTKEAFSQLTDILKPETETLLSYVDTHNLNEVATALGVIANYKLCPEALKIEKSITKTIFDKQVDAAKIEIGNPAIAIIGQVKAGKSTFVNVLLRKNVVAQDYERCTARLTRLTYSKKNFVEVIDEHENVLERKHIKNTVIPKKYLQLSEQERNNNDEINKQIRAGIKSDFLECGIDIIDSPGLSENATLTALSKNMIRSILPVVIYIIDGRTSLKQSDICDLMELKMSIPNLQIIYFITKLDTDDLSESENKSPIELAESKMEITFKKLQFNNFIPTSFKHWSECNYFHGASLHCFMDYCRNKRNPETTFHYKLFSKFESCLHEYLLLNFENKVYEACNILINFQMDVLTKIINRAKILSDFCRENLNQIHNIKRIEEELFNKITSAITDSKRDLMDRLIKRLEEESDSIINPIAEIEYPSSLGIPENGVVMDKKTIEKCLSMILNFLCQGLENVIKKFVEEEFFEKYQAAIESQVSMRMKGRINCSTTKEVKTSYSLCLERLMAENYKFNRLSGLSRSEGDYDIMKFMNIILTSVKRFLLKLFKPNSNKKRLDVRSPAWKLQKAKECLSQCDHHLLAEDVCVSLMNDFNQKHNMFLQALETEFQFVQEKILFSEDIRMEVADKTPDFAGLLMLTLDVKSRYMLKDIQEKEEVGRGAQGRVYRCICNGRELAKKTAIMPITQLNDIAEEIYYSYSFEHPRLLPLIAISITDTQEDGYKAISTYTPLMKTDVLKYIKKKLSTFKDRMNIAVQVAEALEYLHSQKIMHRDLKLANILLDENKDVFLADYGFCKSEGLTGFSYVGSYYHIAPEILKKDIYNYKIDIYSFGILLWYLAEGTGRDPRYGGINKNITPDMRPERPHCIPDELWNLMEMCWDNDPKLRPDINVVMEKLNDIIKKYCN